MSACLCPFPGRTCYGWAHRKLGTSDSATICTVKFSFWASAIDRMSRVVDAIECQNCRVISPLGACGKSELFYKVQETDRP